MLTMKIPCEHKCHTKYGSEHTKWPKFCHTKWRSGHERSPASFFRACGTWFLVPFARKIQKSRPFCNLAPFKSTTEKGRVNPGSNKVKFSNCFFRIKKCVSEPVSSQYSKNAIFISVRCLEMFNITVWKKGINRYGFWSLSLPKIVISTCNLACQMSRHGYITCCTFFWKF